MRSIVVAVDGSEASSVATRTALELSRATGDGLIFVTAWRELRGDFGLRYATVLAPDAVDIEQDWSRDTLAAASALAEQADIRAEAVSRHGRPAHEIVTVARERNARLIVIGTHGLGRIEGLLLGSVSAGVLHHAPCPVLVVPAPAVAA